MRKRMITQGRQDVIPSDETWLDVATVAEVELTSEDPSHPIESALQPGNGGYYRAAEPGEQTLRLLFDKPLRVTRIHLVFQDAEQDRTQEFVLRWAADDRQSYREIVRQQYTFSPPHNTRETEDYTVDLVGLTALELSIIPNISGGPARALVTQLCLG